MQQMGILAITGVCILVLFIVAYRKRIEFFVNFILRSAVGMLAVYVVNSIFMNGQIPLSVGMNAISFLTSGILGIPGVFLLYGIQAYHFL